MPKIIKRAGPTADPVTVQASREFSFRPIDFRGGSQPDQGEESAPDRSEATIAAAEAEAERIQAEAEARADALAREAMARGYDDGKAEGLKAAAEQTREYLERLAELARRASIDRESMLKLAQREMATLALEIAGKVIRREIASDPSIVVTMVESALERVGSAESVRIVVHPDDAPLVKEKWSEMRGAVSFGSNWELVGDDQMERGGCVIESRSGAVDSRIESQLDEISNAFEAWE